MAEKQEPSSSLDVDDSEPITNMEQAAQRARELHDDLVIMLNEQLTPDSSEYKTFIQATRSKLGPGVIAMCTDIFDVFNKLETRGEIRPGFYKPLWTILERAKLVALSKKVQCEEARIQHVLERGKEAEKGGSSTLQICIEPGLLRLQELSERWQTTCKRDLCVFVETNAYRAAKEQIHKHDSVIVLAGSGDGKSFILQRISVDMAEEGYLTLFSKDLDDIENNFVHGQKILYVFDDPVGGPYFIKGHADLWLHKGDLFFKQFTNNGNVKFVFACRKLTWLDCHPTMTSMDLFQNIVDASSEGLSYAEREEMLRKHFGDRMCSSLIRRISSESLVAFPHSCKLLSASDMDMPVEHRIVMRFRKPFKFLCTQIHELREIDQPNIWKYALLVLVMLSKGSLLVQELDADTANDAFKILLEKVLNACSIESNRPFGKLMESATKTCGTFLTRNRDRFEFSHDSIHEAVAVVYGESYPAHILEFCDPELTVSLCRPQNYASETDIGVVKLDRACYPKFVEILSNQVKNGCWAVFRNPAVHDDDIQTQWIEHLGRTDDILSYPSRLDSNIIFFATESGAFKLLSYLSNHSALPSSHSDETCIPFVKFTPPERKEHSENISDLGGRY